MTRYLRTHSPADLGDNKLRKLVKRFWSKVDRPEEKTSDQCWNWIAFTDKDGYGRFKIGNISYAASCVAYWLLSKKPLEDLHVLHSCDNPACVNPAHLFSGTHYDNMQDRDQKGRLADTSGIHNGRVKLSESDVIQIRKDYIPKVISLGSLAKKYNVTKHLIHMIVQKKAWVHLP